MNQKGSLELSVNTLVVIIISLAILSAGITLLYKFISNAEDIKVQLDERTANAIEEMVVDQGKQVALPFHTAKIERGKLHVFGMGILNVYPVKTTFTIEVSFVKVVNELNDEILLSPEERDLVMSWLMYRKSPIELEENEHAKEIIGVTPLKEARAGQYIFSVRVKTPQVSGGGNVNYGTVQKMYVTVT